MKTGILNNPDISVAIKSTMLSIQSQPFINALKSVVSYDSDTGFDSGLLELPEPYTIVVHHLDELVAHKQTLEQRVADAVGDEAMQIFHAADEETIKHLDLVLEFINDVFKVTIEEELSRNAQSPALCTFRMLWLLFRPGTTVYVETNGIKDAYVIHSVSTGPAILSSPFERLAPVRITLWYLDYDGRYLARRKHTVNVQPFKGEKSILSLKIVPAEIWDKQDCGKLRTKLEDEGKHWYNLLAGDQVQYDGDLVDQRNRTFEGRAFVDTASWYELENGSVFEKITDVYQEPQATTDDFRFNTSGAIGGCNCRSCQRRREETRVKNTFDTPTPAPIIKPEQQRWASYDNVDPKIEKDLETTDTKYPPRHRYLLCSRYLKGFVFKTRSWETLDVACCKKPKPNKAPFENLVMPEERKMMIKALVYKYTDPKYKAAGSTSQVWGADFIKNKGEGQIFLLHGGPGVGKTFTAECIAEFTGRPLLSLTCGDIGTEETAIEMQLGKWLKLAHKWGAVMLLDEADVFLEKRLHADLKRNSLVSVFLREIEYYQGILFLTTNRVGKFDDAFISRIHVVLHYPNLNARDRRQIWNLFFDKLEEEKKGTMKISKAAKRYVLKEEMCQVKWNGREIRNAFQTAVALAEYRFITKTEKEDDEKAVLEQKDFKQVCDMTLKFKDYLTAVNDNDNEQQRAGRGKERVVDDEEEDEEMDDDDD